MKKTAKMKIAIWTGVLGILTGVSATAEEVSAADLETLFYTYSKDHMVFDFYEPEEIDDTKQTEQDCYNGFLAALQKDLNGDGTEELLAIRVKYNENENAYVRNDLLAEVYEYQGDRLQRIARYDLAEDILRGNEICTDVFLKETDAGTVLCCEKKETMSLLADGMDWSFRAVSFDGSGFTEIASSSVTGSGWDQETEEEAANALASVGIYPTALFSVSAADQAGNIQRINCIRRYFVTDYDVISDFLWNGGEGSLQYGETCFHSYVNEGIQNKINGEFPEPAVQNTETESEYVIPDSSSRYLGDADLEGLSDFEILLARNEIYAKHGRKFNNEELNAYFSSKSWYQPVVDGNDFTEEYASQVFNEYEMGNIAFIAEYERAHGINQF